MFRLLLAIILTVSFVVFCMANTQFVEVSFIVGRPARLHLIFLLFVTFILGAAFTGFFAMVSRIRLRRKLESLRDHLQTRYEKTEPELPRKATRNASARRASHVN